ncbi:MAG: hypothetical protein K2X47_13720 [Bdellovibrionales bacterium]|nr:hypothetical protein [Bdellovibrionales bacterium]
MSFHSHFYALLGLTLLVLSSQNIAASDRPKVSVVAMGDSLSAGGYNSNGWKVGTGYRWDLKSMESWIGIQLEFKGTMYDGTMTAAAAHEGYSGKRIAEIQSLSQGKIAMLKPDIVLLMVGTNDAIKGTEIRTLKHRVSKLLAQVLAEMPIHGHLLVGIPIPTDNSFFNSNLEQLESAILDLKKLKIPRVTFLNFYRNAKLTPRDLIDGVHPTPEGYKKMADHWAKGLRCILSNRDCQFL